MAKKKQLDKLSLDMIECEKAGFGVHYGRWKVTQKPVKIVPKGIPEDFKQCPECGVWFKPGVHQKYCDSVCQRAVAERRYKQKKAGAIT